MTTRRTTRLAGVVAAAVGDAGLLLVLDNGEHLVDACRELGVPLGQGRLLGRPTDHWATTVPPVVHAVVHGPPEHAAAS